MTIQQKQTRILGALMIGFSVALILLFTLDNSQAHRAYAQEATVTAVPTFTPTAVSAPSQTPVPTPNQTITNTQIFVGQECANQYEIDSAVSSHYFYFWGKSDSWYQITTTEAEIDTRLLLYRNNPQTNPNEPILAENDDKAPGKQDAEIQYLANADSFYWLEVQNVEPGRAGTYCLEVKFSDTTPTPSPPPDPCEDNYWFNTACEIQLNKTNPDSDTDIHFNFAPASGQGEDNDFYKVWVKQGESYVCRTFALSANNDTNMILYDQNQNGLGGNDDTQPGDRGSKLNVTVNYTGWLYILVGPNTEIAPGNGEDYTYKLECRYEGLITPTPFDGGSNQGDECENNDSFDLASACLLQGKQDNTKFTRENMNFAGWGGGSRDPDYYKLWAIEGFQYTCETTNLSANNDTYMKIFYPENPLTPIGENDNRAANGGGFLGSLVTIDVSRTGWLLILVEPKMPELYGDGTLYKYTLTCGKEPAVPAPVSSGLNTAPAGSVSVAPPPEDPATENETDANEEETSETEAVVVTIKEIPPLKPTPTPTPALNNAAFILTIYYDQNNNHIVEDGEGIANMPIYIYIGSGNNPLTEVTSGKGELAIAFSTSANSVRLVVPYLSIDQQIPILNTQEVRLRIASQ